MKTDMKEVERISGEYKNREPSKLDALRKIDRSVKAPAEIFAYTFGSAGSLVLGTGMCLAMGVIGSALANPVGMVLGVAVGVVGIAMVSVNYLIYKTILSKRKARRAEEVLRLSSEILNEDGE